MNIACQHPIEPIPAPEIADTAIVAGRRRGRGAGINPSGRFEAYARTGFDDGWGDGEELPPFKTTVQVEPARSVITRNDSPDIAFDRSLNPYRGCEHGCIYCCARPNHAYLGLSPGLDFETQLYAKTNAAEVLERQLGAPGEFARAYVVAHEVGHHVQTLLGTTEKVDSMRGRISQSQQNQLSVRMELQADCYAGIWANKSQQAKNWLEQGDIESAMNAAARIGDDALQRQQTGAVRPDSFTHGSSAQRQRWFMQGLKTGSVQACDTFNTQNL